MAETSCSQLLLVESGTYVCMYVRTYAYAQDQFTTYHMKYCKVLQGTPQTQYSLVSYSQGHIRTYICTSLSRLLCRSSYCLDMPLTCCSFCERTLANSFSRDSICVSKGAAHCMHLYVSMYCTVHLHIQVHPQEEIHSHNLLPQAHRHSDAHACPTFSRCTDYLNTSHTYVHACVRTPTHPIHTHTHTLH